MQHFTLWCTEEIDDQLQMMHCRTRREECFPREHLCKDACNRPNVTWATSRAHETATVVRTSACAPPNAGVYDVNLWGSVLEAFVTVCRAIPGGDARYTE